MYVEQLTSEQEALLETYATKWVKIGREFKTLDKKKVEPLIAEIVKNGGYGDKPIKIFYSDDPIAGIDQTVNYAKQHGKKLTRQQILNSTMYGCHEVAWLGFYDYMENVVNVNADFTKIHPFQKVSTMIGWWSAWDCDDHVACFVQQKPVKVSLNEDNQLHCDDDMAIKYASGYGLYAIEDHIVEEKFVMTPDLVTPQDLMEIDNADLRAILTRRYGWNRFVTDTNAKTIDTRINHVEGTKEALFDTKLGHVFVVTCPTGRIFGLPVRDDITTCQQAAEWMGPQFGGKPVNLIGRT